MEDPLEVALRLLPIRRHLARAMMLLPDPPQPNLVSLPVIVVEVGERLVQERLRCIVDVREIRLLVLGVRGLNHGLLDHVFQVRLLLRLLSHEVVPQAFASACYLPEIPQQIRR